MSTVKWCAGDGGMAATVSGPGRAREKKRGVAAGPTVVAMLGIAWRVCAQEEHEPGQPGGYSVPGAANRGQALCCSIGVAEPRQLLLLRGTSRCLGALP